MSEYIVINVDTAEVEFFSNKEMARKFITDKVLINKCIIMPCVEVTDAKEVEIVIVPNSDRNSIFGSVAEYQEDVYNSDFINAPDIPVKYMQGYEYYKE